MGIFLVIFLFHIHPTVMFVRLKLTFFIIVINIHTSIMFSVVLNCRLLAFKENLKKMRQEFFCFALFHVKLILCQYRLERTNPLKELGKSLNTFQRQAYDGQILALKCPIESQVILKSSIYFRAVSTLDHYCECFLWITYSNRKKSCKRV